MSEFWELDELLPNEENQKIINAFLLSLKNANKKKRTVIEYRNRLKFFFKGHKAHFSSISSHDIQQWLEKQSNWKKRTIGVYTGTLRAFYTFCFKEGYIHTLPNLNKGRKKGITDANSYWELKVFLQNEENQNVLQEYLLSRKNKTNNKQSIVRQRIALQFFFLDWEKPFSSITAEEIQKWFEGRKSKWNKKTIESHIGLLRTFYDFCVQKGYMENPPLKKNRWVKSAEKYWEVQQPLANQENQEAINEFLLTLKKKDYTKKTIEEHRVALQRFFREKKELFSSITSEEVQQWMIERQKNRKNKTVFNCLTFLRSFYRFCIKEGSIEQSPVKYQWEWDKTEDRYWVLNKRLPNDKNQNVINDFLLSMKVQNFSSETIKYHRYFLQRFFKDREETYDTLEPETIQNWLLNQKGVKERTMVSYLRHLSTFYHFCVEEGYIERSPIKSRWFPRLPQPIPKFLGKDEIAKVRLQSEKENLRNQVIVEFLLVTGCRIREVHLLNKEDIDFENRSARVLGKGGKIRTVHFTQKCAMLLERYLKNREDDDPALFVTAWGRRLVIRQLQTIIEKVGKQAELSGSLHPHRFRHTFATELVAKGADLLFIADELGHKSIETTLIYAQLPNQELISMYRRYMG